MKKASWPNDGHKKTGHPILALLMLFIYWFGLQVVQLACVRWGLLHYPGQGGFDQQTQILNTYPLYYLVPYLIWILFCFYLMGWLGLRLFSRKAPDLRFWAGLISGLVLVIIVQAGMGALTARLYPDQLDSTNQIVITRAIQAMPKWKLVLVIVVLPAITEEVFTRGLVMRYILPAYPRWGIFLSSFLFASLHATNLWIHFLTYFLLGASLGYAYYRSGRIESSILLHAINNLMGILPYLTS